MVRKINWTNEKLINAVKNNTDILVNFTYNTGRIGYNKQTKKFTYSLNNGLPITVTRKWVQDYISSILNRWKSKQYLSEERNERESTRVTIIDGNSGLSERIYM